MNPYYADAQATIYLGDCREVYPELPLPDVAIVDAPYGETGIKWDKWAKNWPTLLEKTPCFWCWGSLRMFWDHRDEFDAYKLAQDIVWEKQNGTAMHNDRFRRVHELLCQFYPHHIKWADLYHQAPREPTGRRKVITRSAKPKHWGKTGVNTYDSTSRLVRSVIRARNGHKRGQDTTEKPLSVLRHLITYSCPPSGMVTDLFCGSGSTLLAAREVGRRAIGIDVNEAECEKAARRLAQAHLPL